MSSKTPTELPPGDDALLKNSALYRRFLEERDEILRHKWLRSEEEGADIGFENALLEWMMNHRSGWHANRKRSS